MEQRAAFRGAFSLRRRLFRRLFKFCLRFDSPALRRLPLLFRPLNSGAPFAGFFFLRFARLTRLFQRRVRKLRQGGQSRFGCRFSLAVQENGLRRLLRFFFDLFLPLLLSF